MSHRAHIAVPALALLIATSGCSLKNDYDHVSITFWEKVDHLVRVDQHNETLREENVRLKAENLRLQRKLAGQHQEERSSYVKTQAHDEGGTAAARVTHSLVPEFQGGAGAHHAEAEHHAPAEHHAAAEHHAPAAGHGDAEDHDRAPASAQEDEPAVTLLSAPPKKIFDTALAAFQREEYDRAARGFVSLADNKENSRYATPEVHFMAGVSLYKVRNYQVAIKHLDRVLAAHGAEAQGFASKALMWKALCLKKLGREEESRHAAQTILERYPASAEAQKVK